MDDIIVGLGRQKSIADVIHLAEDELQRSQGKPRSVIACASGIEVHAERDEFEGPFTSYAVTLRLDGKVLELVKQLPEESQTPCSLEKVDDLYELRWQRPDEGDQEGTLDVDEKLVQLIYLPEVWRIRGEKYRHDHLSLDVLVSAMTQFRASDVHLYPGASPVFRVDNAVRHSEHIAPLSAEQIRVLIREIAPEKDWQEFEEESQCSFGYHQKGLAYLRVSAFIKSGSPHCTLRFLPEQIPSFDDLNIPRDIMENLGAVHYGLILVTGMTGSGKSTTVASLIDWINANKKVHILAVEDPVEYVHHNRKAIVSQRNVGTDVKTFDTAIRSSLRQDPDVIFIGEMRDPPTIRAAINAASTGHLVISTLHANTSSEVINRIVSFFDPVERDLVSLQLADCIRCIMCQRLLPRIGGGRVPALEFMFNDMKYIHDSILAGDSTGIRVGMQQTLSESLTFEEHLLSLFKANVITHDNAQKYASNADVFEQRRHGTYVIPTLESMLHHHDRGH